MVEKAGLIVGHNVSFDLRMIRILGARLTGDKWASQLPTACTMRSTTNIVRILKRNPRTANDWKWPTLAEAYRHFFGEDLADAHRARPDADASARIFFHLKDKALI